MPDNWEYEIESIPEKAGEAKRKLNELHEMGWELVCIFNHPNPRLFFPLAKGLDGSSCFAIFKRPILLQGPKH